MLNERNDNEFNATEDEPSTDGRQSASNGQNVSVRENVTRQTRRRSVEDEIHELDDIDGEDDFDDEEDEFGDSDGGSMSMEENEDDQDLNDVDKDECAKAMHSHKRDNARRNDISIDVDEPNDDVYVTRSETEPHSARKSDDDSKRPASDNESANKNGTSTKGRLMNGAHETNAANIDETASGNVSDEPARNAAGKSSKRKLSISSDDEEHLPPSKAYVSILSLFLCVSFMSFLQLENSCEFNFCLFSNILNLTILKRSHRTRRQLPEIR